MTKDKETQNLRCNKCRAQTECSSLKDTLDEMRCGLNGGHIDDSCKVNLTLNGKAVFGIKQILQEVKSTKKDEQSSKKVDDDSNAKKK